MTGVVFGIKIWFPLLLISASSRGRAGVVIKELIEYLLGK
jgi:hypothetical protein